MNFRSDQNCLSYWFPKLEAAGVPVPRTRILKMPAAAQACVWAAMDGRDGTPEETEAMQAFLVQLRAAAQEIGSAVVGERPAVFLRTGHTAGKHSWRKTCCVTDLDKLPEHVFRLAEHSEVADMMGMPWDTWVIREMLPVAPLGTCPNYGDMPVVREFRFFVQDGQIVCAHPYWPLEALAEGGATNPRYVYAALCRTEVMSEMIALARMAGQAVPGAWSVDILETVNGPMVTDMAAAAASFHWPGCPLQGEFA